MKLTRCLLSTGKELADFILELDCHHKEICVGLGNRVKSEIFERCHPLATLDQRFPYKESEERDPLVACSEAFQMIGPIKLSHSTGGIWV